MKKDYQNSDAEDGDSDTAAPVNIHPNSNGKTKCNLMNPNHPSWLQYMLQPVKEIKPYSTLLYSTAEKILHQVNTKNKQPCPDLQLFGGYMGTEWLLDDSQEEKRNFSWTRKGREWKGAGSVESGGTRRFWDVDLQEATQVSLKLEVNKKDEWQLQMIKNEIDDNWVKKKEVMP